MIRPVDAPVEHAPPGRGPDVVAELPLVAGRTAFGGDPASYARARPGYPADVYDQLGRLCDIASSRIFEVGPGTGQATDGLLALNPVALTAIEPDHRLADHLATELGPRFPRLEVVRAGFMEASLASGSFDLGVAATSFHWLEQAAALGKVVGLLRPGGWWSMWWNVFGDPDDPDELQAATRDLYRGLPTSRSWQSGGRVPFALDTRARLGDLQAAGLAETRTHLMRWTLTMDTARVVALAGTFSQVSQAGPPERERFLGELAEVMERRFGGRTERRFMTSMYAGRKP